MDGRALCCNTILPFKVDLKQEFQKIYKAKSKRKITYTTTIERRTRSRNKKKKAEGKGKNRCKPTYENDNMKNKKIYFYF